MRLASRYILKTATRVEAVAVYFLLNSISAFAEVTK